MALLHCSDRVPDADRDLSAYARFVSTISIRLHFRALIATSRYTKNNTVTGSTTSPNLGTMPRFRPPFDQQQVIARTASDATNRIAVFRFRAPLPGSIASSEFKLRRRQ
jgi:hypothetical protein